MEKLRSLAFCIIGCGGTGAGFAEMLVRSGVTRLILVDGEKVKASDLNRITAFSRKDVGRPKVDALRGRLLDIRDDLDITALSDSFRDAKELVGGHEVGWHVRDAVHDAEVVFIGTDTNRSRLAIEQLLRDRPSENPVMHLSCGVHVDGNAKEYYFECSWSPKTPDCRADDHGYGPENASYAAIVQEATAVSFSMLLSHLISDASEFRYYSRRYGPTMMPVETHVDGRTSSSKQPSQ